MEVSGEKSKEADGKQMDGAKDNRTVFVRGIAFSIDQQPFEEAFSDVGPVKQCFLVRDKGAPKHKGCGFVQYALPEDAQRALKEMNGRILGGRKLQVDLANKRAPLEERKRKRQQLEVAADGQAAPSKGKAGESQKEGKQKKQQQQQQEDQEQEQLLQKKGKQQQQQQQQDQEEEEHAEQPPRKKSKQEKQQGRGGPDLAGGPDAVTVGFSAAQKHRMQRAVALGGLSPAVLQQAIELARQVGKLEEVIEPFPKHLADKAHLRADGCHGDTVILVYETVAQAAAAIAKLHNAKIKPSVASSGKKAAKKAGKKGDKQGAEADNGVKDDEEVPEEPVHVLWARQVTGEGAHVRKWRVIVRNLPFSATDASVRAALQQAGFVWELTLPRAEDGKLRGFAFAAYTTRAQAEKAIKVVNGTKIGPRMVSVDWALGKSQFEAAKKGSETPSGVDSDLEEESEGDDDVDMEGDQEDLEDNKAQASEGEDEEASDSGDGDSYAEFGGEEDGSDDDNDEDDEDDDSKEEDQESSGEESEEEEVNKHDIVAGTPESHALASEHGITASVLHNVLAEKGEADSDAEGEEEGGRGKNNKEGGGKAGKGKGKEGGEAGEGKAGLKKDGAKDKDGQSDAAAARTAGAVSTSAPGPQQQQAGYTVFVRGLPLDVTQVQLQAKMEAYGRVKACRLVIDKASSKPKGTAFVEFKAPEGARKAADACARGRQNRGPGVVVGGRPIDVDLALSQEGARQLAASKAGTAVQGKDKRNLYLAKEGDIPAGSPAWTGMSEHDRQKRKRGAEEKATKLKSPNFVVSSTRLSVRNIPFSMTEAKLRSLATKAVKERASKEKPEIKQVKILREDEESGKVGSDGKPRSKGLGFIEFSKQDHAIACLRQLNNNPTAFTAERRPIVEFAIDNVKVLKKLENIKARGLRMKLEREAAAGSSAAGAAAGDESNESKGDWAKRGAGGQNGAAGKGSATNRKAQEGGGGGPEEANPGASEEEGPEQEEDGEPGAGHQELSIKERRRLRAKAKMQRRRERRVAQSKGEGGGEEAGSKAVPQNGPVPSAPGTGKRAAKKQKQLQKQQQQQQKQQRQQPQKEQQKPERERGGDREGGKQQRRKRQAEDKMDRLANEGLHENGGRPEGMKKRRRGSELEGTDRLDKLAQSYVAKLSGASDAQVASGNGRPQAGSNSKARGAKQQQQQQQQQRSAGKKKQGKGMAAAGKEASSTVGKAKGPAAPVVKLKLDAGEGIKRWFE